MTKIDDIRVQFLQPLEVIAAEFPRIAIRVEDEWGTYELHQYLTSLVFDERGNRQGFPPHVMSAILQVYQTHDNEHGFVDNAAIWWQMDKNNYR